MRPRSAISCRCRSRLVGAVFAVALGTALERGGDTGQIIAAELTSKDVDDGSQVGPLLEQIAAPVSSFTGDGAYDRDDVYREVCQRHPDAAVIVPPRLSAVPSATAETAPTKRDRHLQLIAERGRMGWQRGRGTVAVPWWRPISVATSE